jgi:uncharacterized protein YaiL (DUF2058 family)
VENERLAKDEPFRKDHADAETREKGREAKMLRDKELKRKQAEADMAELKLF